MDHTHASQQDFKFGFYHFQQLFLDILWILYQEQKQPTMTFIYSPTQLLNIATRISATCLNTLSSPTWKRIKNLGICQKFIKRGCRAGQFKVRRIKPVITTESRTVYPLSQSGANISNLTQCSTMNTNYLLCL